MLTSPQPHPVVTIKSKQARRVRQGHPWAYSNELLIDQAAKALPAGSMVTLRDEGGEALGTWMFNPHTLIAARKLADKADVEIDAGFLKDRLQSALGLRERLFDRPFYRLVHAEADGLPGLIIDRFCGTLVIQPNTAGIDGVEGHLMTALEELLAPERVILKCDSPARLQEGMEQYVQVVKGAAEGEVALEEGGAHYVCDPVGGQKTGWFYDHRPNRAFVAGLCEGRRVIDFYSYAGSFSLQCARAGAAHVTAVDRSDGALSLLAKAAALNGVADRVETVTADCFKEMEARVATGEQFGVVIADPPAFVKNKKALASGAKGYRKMTRLAARLVEPGGILLVASCSHHMALDNFTEQVRRGLADAGRQGRILHTGGAGPDHPVHPMLPESAYLKAQVLALD